MIELSEEQLRCQAAVVQWDADPNKKQVFRIDGFAGVGKTSVIRQTVDMLPGLTLYVAFTGKAALVMQQRGCEPVSTIHRLIYTPSGTGSKTTLESKEKELSRLLLSLEQDGWSSAEISDRPDVQKLAASVKQLKASANSPIFRLNLDSPIKEAERVVIDESSMVGRSLAQDLLSFDVPVIAQGDPGQLPPVGDVGYFTNGKPDFMLTEIHRQAADSPIIKLATRARKGQPLESGTYGESRVMRQSELTPELAMSADIILCGRNKTRHLNNARMRALQGFGGEMPQPGEKLVCLRNNHEKGLLNGSLWKVVRCNKYGHRKLSLTVEPEDGGIPITVLAHSQYFTEYGRTETEGWVKRLIQAEESIGFEIRDAESFKYCSLLKVHNAQGSQWDNILVIDESSQFGADAKKHLYTAITRAVSKVTIAK
jgi:exodeoxyribonuclease-5